MVCCRPRVTPQTFLAFVTLYSHQLRTRAQAATSAVQRLRTGCARLREADTQIAEMRKSMQHLQPLATAKSRVRLCWSWSAPHLLANYTMGTGHDCPMCTCTDQHMLFTLPMMATMPLHAPSWDSAGISDGCCPGC